MRSFEAVATSNIEIVRTGLDAYKSGDLDTVAGLLAEDVRWDGIGGQSCANREEAKEALRAGAPRAAGLELADAVPFGTDKVMVCLVRLGADEDEDDAPPARIYNVVSFADEKVVRMQAFLNRREAVQAARGVKPPSPAADAGPAKAGGGKGKKSVWRRTRMSLGRALGRG